MKTVKAFLAGLLIVLFVLFIFQNMQALSHTEQLRFSLPYLSITSPPIQMFFLLLGVFMLGYTIAHYFRFRERRRLLEIIRNLKRQQSRTDEELSGLRNLPIADDEEERRRRSFFALRTRPKYVE